MKIIQDPLSLLAGGTCGEVLPDPRRRLSNETRRADLNQMRLLPKIHCQLNGLTAVQKKKIYEYDIRGIDATEPSIYWR